MMNKKIFLLALVLVALWGCRSTTAPRSAPTAPPNGSTGDGRTVIARPETTETPPGDILIEEEEGVEGKIPTTTPDATEAAIATRDAVAAGETPNTPAEQGTPEPTVEIVRPLLPTPGPTGQGSQPNTPKQGEIGTTIDLGGATITVTGTERSGPNQGDLPRQGNEFLIVSFTLKNSSNRVLTFDASQFVLRANDGTIILYDDVTFQDNLLRTADMQPNETRNTSVVFQIPTGSNGYTLVLGDPATGGIANIRLN